MTFSVYHTAAQAQTSTDATTCDVVSFDPATPTAYVGADYDVAGAFSDATVLDDIAVLSVTDNAYTDFTVATTSVDGSGYTSYGLRLDPDRDWETS